MDGSMSRMDDGGSLTGPSRGGAGYICKRDREILLIARCLSYGRVLSQATFYFNSRRANVGLQIVNIQKGV